MCLICEAIHTLHMLIRIIGTRTYLLSADSKLFREKNKRHKLEIQMLKRKKLKTDFRDFDDAAAATTAVDTVASVNYR